MHQTPPPPQRIQRRRTKGWRLPESAVIVTRPTRWGNPWREGTTHASVLPGGIHDRSGRVLTRADAVASYRNTIEADPEQIADIRHHLAGRDLACWCPLPAPGQPDICHGAVLLQIANRPHTTTPHH